MADTSATFIAWLKDARAAAGLSQQNVADALKAQGFRFHQTMIAKIERGERPVRLDEAVAFAALFGTTLDATLGLTVAGLQSGTSLDLARRTSLLQHISSLVEAELGGHQ